MRVLPICAFLLILIGSVPKGFSAEGHDAALAILRKHCTDCHGADLAESGLRLDTASNALRGGESGEPAIVPGKSMQSYLLQRVLHKDPKKRMPPEAPPLLTEEVATLRKWIDRETIWKTAQDELKQARRSDHWSFQPIRRAREIPGDEHPVDHFIQKRLADAKLSMSPRASRRKLIRRAFLVLHGLPPIPERVTQFVADERPNAWRLLVDELLDSPRFGEHMAVPWLDLVHFGETHGFETNRERPNAWPYRDWVIDAFNADKPYNEFVIEQLAGDALGADAATGFLVAGPYDVVKGQDKLFQLIQRQDELADMINTTGTAFLGLTLGCARCHNHKFDPVTQTDYYALQAVFAGVNHAERALPMTAAAKARLAKLDREIGTLREQLAKFVKPSADNPQARRPAVTAKQNIESFPAVLTKFVRFSIDATNQSQPCIDELEIFSGKENVALATKGAKASSAGDFVHPLHRLEHINDGRYGNSRSWIAAKAIGGWVQIEFPEPAKIDRIVWARDREERYRDRLAIRYRIEGSIDGKKWNLLASSADRVPFSKKPPQQPVYDFAAFPDAVAAAGREKLKRLGQLSTERVKLAQGGKVYAGTFRQPGTTHRLYRGDPSAPREAVTAAAIKSLTDLSWADSTPERERRLALAKWIASDDNPLTARVIVNRLWQFHFGTGLVATPSDFGRNGVPPSHPELLDWLAAELIEHDWSLKHIHRLILTSATWQQDSRPHKQALAVDSDSRLLWRFPPRRLSAEGIRDAILTVSGKLDLTMGGPGFSAFEVEPENVRHYFPKKDFGPADWRRMVYMTRVRQERDAVFGVFDCLDFSQVVPQRSRSTTPLQALNLLNSRFVTQQAEFLAARLHAKSTNEAERVALAYEFCFGRAPSAEETQAALTFIRETGWPAFTRAMLNANEFVFIP